MRRVRFGAGLAIVAGIVVVCEAAAVSQTVSETVSQTVSETGSQTVSQTVSETVCGTRDSNTVPHTVRGTVRGTGKPDSAGRAAYAKACESCHGPEGQGGTAPAVVPFTLELSELIAIVRQGIGVMPGIPRDRISDEEISAIRDYLASLKN